MRGVLATAALAALPLFIWEADEDVGETPNGWGDGEGYGEGNGDGIGEPGEGERGGYGDGFWSI